MSFYTALTGLNGAQSDISATSNNIANVNTTGFKRSRAEFVIFLQLHRYKTLHHQLVLVQFLKVLSSSLLRVTLPPLLNVLDIAISVKVSSPLNHRLHQGKQFILVTVHLMLIMTDT